MDTQVSKLKKSPIKYLLLYKKWKFIQNEESESTFLFLRDKRESWEGDEEASQKKKKKRKG